MKPTACWIWGSNQGLDRIAPACGDKRQTALFTATLDKRVRSLAANLLKSPVDVRLADALGDIPDSIDHAIYFADDHNHKMEILDKLLARDDVGWAIIFATTQEAAAELGERLIELGQHAGVVHGGMDTPDRLTVVNVLREQEVRLLVATDVAARGMDVSQVGHVIQVNAPIFAEDYVHPSAEQVGQVGTAQLGCWHRRPIGNACQGRTLIRPYACSTNHTGTRADVAHWQRNSPQGEATKPQKGKGCQGRKPSKRRRLALSREKQEGGKTL